jgi:threonyl-tRNA synthetase
MRLSLHSKEKLGIKYVNEPQLWLETEELVRNVLIESKIPFVEVADEAAFYGPKIDVQIYSVIGREFTLATNQVDFSQGRSFKLEYITPDNTSETPLIIHRAPLGTHERFIGFLLEHYAGRLPLWLSPVQVKILPISDKFLPYAKEVFIQLKKAGIRVETDERSEKVGKKIRDAELSKVPYMLVIGERETTERKLSIRKNNKTEAEPQAIEEFINLLKEEIAERKG